MEAAGPLTGQAHRHGAHNCRRSRSSKREGAPAWCRRCRRHRPTLLATLLALQGGHNPQLEDDANLLEPLLAPVASLTPGSSSAALPLLCDEDRGRDERRRRREWVQPGYWESYAYMVRLDLGGLDWYM